MVVYHHITQYSVSKICEPLNIPVRPVRADQQRSLTSLNDQFCAGNIKRQTKLQLTNSSLIFPVEILRLISGYEESDTLPSISLFPSTPSPSSRWGAEIRAECWLVLILFSVSPSSSEQILQKRPSVFLQREAGNVEIDCKIKFKTFSSSNKDTERMFSQSRH